jgi:hypothetical protein
MKLNRIYTFGFTLLITLPTQGVRAENWASIGMCSGNSVYHKAYYFEKEYIFHDCR